MAYIIEFEPKAVQDIAELKKTGNKAAIIKIEKLLLELREHPTTGTGQVEALKDNLSGFWSRRIDKFNRMIYTIKEDVVTVTVVSAKGHYNKK
ncbi:Txe/YoeB family addiction module toxin [Bacteroides ovatus]|jgi:toxin YoeB|uniref:Txe/YoeB family addiction module toxin n=1 Tax=Bacteroides ovatus TaxID=28116 RepID=UPI0011060296|nr:Txe/YoeB family addiction module toxin [Bacteroides ovatus]